MKKPLRKNSKPPETPIVPPTFGLLPEAILTQLNENSAGGYIVMVLNADGEPQIYTSFDNAMYRVALTRFAADFFAAADANISDAIRAMNNPPQDEN